MPIYDAAIYILCFITQSQIMDVGVGLNDELGLLFFFFCIIVSQNAPTILFLLMLPQLTKQRLAVTQKRKGRK